MEIAMSDYLQTTRDVYKEAAESPQIGLCCTTTPVWRLPGLSMPQRMLEMNYGCGSTVHPRDLDGGNRVLYVGVGGGMELLQFAYFTRSTHSVVGIDSVPEMLQACRANLQTAAEQNDWFSPEMVELRAGDALSLPVDDNQIDVAAQNCLFNIFREADLKQALGEMYRVLKPHGRLILSDPICDDEMPDSLRNDEKLRALCLSGALPLEQYVGLMTEAGFGTIEIRARRPYRILDPRSYNTDRRIITESVEIAAIKDPMPDDGPCIFTGRHAIYIGADEFFDDGKGHTLLHNQPLAVCDKTADALKSLGRDDIHITESTYFYDGGGCC